MTDRVVVLVDMDCFYCQVEVKLNPSLTGKPVAVVQYNEWRGGGIIAVNYEARAKGVTRAMRGDEAKKLCPDIALVKTRTVGDKADLTEEASSEVFAVLSTYSEYVLRASIDEAYLDLTEVVKKRRITEPTVTSSKLPNTFIVGYTSDKTNEEEERRIGTEEWLSDIYKSELQDDAAANLAVAAVIVEEMRHDVYLKTGFRCSAGIAHNKTLAKVVCGLHKPNRQTVIPHCSVPALYRELPPRKIRSLGGKLGLRLTQELSCSVMADLLNFSLKQLQEAFDDRAGRWLYDIARGYDYEPVTSRLISKSIGCCKQFPGKTALASSSDVEHWLKNLSAGLAQRVLADQMQNKRSPQLLTVSVTIGKRQTSSKSVALHLFDADKIYSAALPAVKKLCCDHTEQNWIPIFCLGVSASKFTEKAYSKPISAFLKPNTAIPIVEEASLPTADSNETGFFSKFITEQIEDDSRDAESKVETSDESSVDNSREAMGKSSPYFTEVKSDSVKLKDSKVKDFFKQVPVKEEKEKRKVQLKDFFRNSNKREVPDLLDVFPDPENVDEELLDSLPASFRRKLLELKKVKNTDKGGGEKVGGNREEGGAEGLGLKDYRLHKVSSNVGDVEVPEAAESWFKTRGCLDKSDLAEVTELVPSTSELVPSTSESRPSTSSELVKCDECGEEVLSNSLREHLDLHLAMRLHTSLNPSPPPPRPSLPNLPTKRKNNTKDSKTKKTKTITKYFTR